MSQTETKPMLLITQHANKTETAQATLTLPFDQRQKARFKCTLDNGNQAGLQLERGRILRGGDLLKATDGTIIKIKAANETVTTAQATGHLLAKICYHLGNRHVPLQIEKGWCRYQHDHVLDDMVKQLGAKIITEKAPFEPESGAYAQGHDHGHSHSHSHDH